MSHSNDPLIASPRRGERVLEPAVQQRVPAVGREDVVVSISVVSHNQFALVRKLLLTLERHRPQFGVELILRLNTPEDCSVEELHLSYPVIVVRNTRCQGFGRNHNASFLIARGRYYCILNPDVTFTEEVFAQLLDTLEQSQAGIVAPKVVDAHDRIQANFRRMPLPHHLFIRMFRGGDSATDLVHVGKSGLAYPDWTPGMFMLMRSDLFKALGGFDERYFLYYEDVDLGTRCRLAGHSVAVDTRVKVIHEARFASHRRPSYCLVHCLSMARFFLSGPFWRALRSAKRR